MRIGARQSFYSLPIISILLMALGHDVTLADAIRALGH